MSQDRATALFFELFEGLPRQGPGDDASTRRALELLPGIGPDTRVLDLGCGTGRQTRVLAQHSPARIVAIDSHRPFVEELERQARALGVADRIDARVGDMRQLDFASGAFDVIWCESAIFVVGFEAGLSEWRRLLVPGGFAAVSEVCWTQPGAPPECAAFWAEEYPAIREVPALVAAIESCGYEPVSHFPLPPSAWWDEYYRPLQGQLTAFRARHRDEAGAQALADQVQHEIDMWRGYSNFYGYEFFVMRSR
jgi:ubiquinone/menaquinone biosynthesis C-methylase UbiE